MTKQLPRLETVKTVPSQLQATALARPPSHCKAAPIAAVPPPVLGLNGLGRVGLASRRRCGSSACPWRARWDGPQRCITVARGHATEALTCGGASQAARPAIFASKGSGVRAPLAPLVRGLEASNSPEPRAKPRANRYPAARQWPGPLPCAGACRRPVATRAPTASSSKPSARPPGVDGCLRRGAE